MCSVLLLCLMAFTEVTVLSGLGFLYCKYFEPSKASNSTAMEIVLSKGDGCANCACRFSSGFPKPGTYCSMIRSTRNKKCLWRSCFNRSGRNAQSLLDCPQMLPIKFRLNWPSRFRGNHFLRDRPTRNKNCLCRPCFLTDRDESIDVSYQVSVHLAKRFRRRLKCEKLTDDGHQVMEKAHFVTSGAETAFPSGVHH